MIHLPVHFAYFSLIGALLSLGCLGILHKLADRYMCRASAISFLLFSWAAVFVGAGCAIYTRRGGFAVPLPVVLVAAVCGAFASLAILSFQAGLRHGDIATSWLIINLSTAVPTVLSILVYQEKVGFRRGLSLIVAALALVFLWQDGKRQKTAGTNPAGCAEPPQHTLEKRID